MATTPSWTAHLPEWIPHSLDDLHGPRVGIVELPIELCWSGVSSYDVQRFRQRVAMYELVMVQGLRDHYRQFLDADYLLDAWPFLHYRVAEGFVQAWEERFPELARLGADRAVVRRAVERWKAESW